MWRRPECCLCQQQKKSHGRWNSWLLHVPQPEKYWMQLPRRESCRHVLH